MRANPALKKMKLLKNVRLIVSLLTDLEYQEILRMAGIVATPGIPLPGCRSRGRFCCRANGGEGWLPLAVPGYLQLFLLRVADSSLRTNTTIRVWEAFLPGS